MTYAQEEMARAEREDTKLAEAYKIISPGRASWELQAMAKALSMMSFLNTDEENVRLAAVRLILRRRSARARSHKQAGKA